MTREKRYDIIVELSRRRDGERSLKIEQQERLYKALRSAKYEISSIELYILNKVREAKKE